MKTKFLFSVISLLVIVVLCNVQLFGQETTGSMVGNVTDQSGAVMPGVTVTITNLETGQKQTVFTGSDGEFNALELKPSRYSARFELEGFTSQTVTDIVVYLGRTSKVNASLEVGGIEQAITVEYTQTIDTSTTMVALNIPSEEFEQLPTGRNFQDLAVFQTSVNTGTVEAGFQVNGASAAENNYYIDGASTTSLLDGSARQTAVLEYLQEVQVKTAGLEAEYGGAMGGVVTAVTKSGGNDFHGEMHYYYYGNGLSADPSKRLELSPTDYKTVAYIQDEKQKAHRQEIGGTLSGPMLKDKVWFFSSFAPHWNSYQYGYRFTDGDKTTMTRNSHSKDWFSKLSWDPTSRIRTNFTFLYTPQYMTGGLYSYDGMEPNLSTQDVASANGYRTRGYNQPESSFTGHIDFTLTNASILSVKGGRYYLNYKDTGVPYTTYYWWYRSSVGMEGVPEDLQREAGYTTPSARKTKHDITTRTYVQADFSQYLNFAGSHDFKFGVGVQKNVNNVEKYTYGEKGRVHLYWGDVYDPDNPGIYGWYLLHDARTFGSAGATITHLYFQDSWRIIPRLTLNIGLRTEREIIPSFDKEQSMEYLGTENAIEFGFSEKLAPRLGAALDVFGNGKLKVYGGWGRYFDWTKYELSRGSFGGDFWHAYYRNLDTTDIYSINLDNMPGDNLWDSEYRDWRYVGFDSIDPDIKPMSLDRLNAGMDWEIAPRIVFSASYSRSKLNRTIEDIGVVDPTDGSEHYSYGNPGEGANKYGGVNGATCEVEFEGTCGVKIPKAERVYNALELTISRRFGDGWLGNISYVYSELWGNYSGLQSTDEITPPTLGYGSTRDQSYGAEYYRPGGNVNRYFDLDEIMFDAHGNVGVYGPLPTDRPHVLKIYGSKQFSFGTDIGFFFRVMSGTPVSTLATSANNTQILVEGRGDMGRTPVLNMTDLMVSHKINVGEGRQVQFQFTMENLFNQKTATFIFDRYNREDWYDTSGMNMDNVDLLEGYDWKQLVSESSDANDPEFGNIALDRRYGMEAMWNSGFSGRFLIKYIF